MWFEGSIEKGTTAFALALAGVELLTGV